jgi:hypothetical protein
MEKKFAEAVHFRGEDVHFGRLFLWTRVVNPPCPEEVIKHLYLEVDMDDYHSRAESGQYHRQYSHDYQFGGLRLVD